MKRVFYLILCVGFTISSCGNNDADKKPVINKDSAEEAYKQMEMLTPDSNADFAEDTNVHTITPKEIYGDE